MRTFLVLTLMVAAGCNQNPPATSPPPDKTDVHIQTPKVKVDVHGKGTGANVDVERN